MAEHVSEDPFWLFRKFWRDSYPRITAAQYLDLKTYLVDDVLTKVDRASMAHGLEVRVPLLDHKLVEVAFSISSRLVYANGERKHLLKRALYGLLPDEVLSTRKQGFIVPINEWFAQGLRRFAAQVLADGSLVSRSIINPDHVAEFVSSSPSHHVWHILALELWARRWLEGVGADLDLPSLLGS